MIEKIINIIDYPNKLKVLKFFREYLKDEPINLIDIGAHKGETINFFNKNFNINKIIAFEPNKDLFEKLNKKIKKQNILLLNYGVGTKNENKKLNITIDTASSTFNEINFETKYFKRKKNFYLFNKNQSFIKDKQSIQIINLSDFILKNEKKIDVLKIDTEGYEYNILKGIKKLDLKKIRFIYFEHHYDLMIEKRYKFSDINNLLKQNNFLMKLKIRMKFRKSFEYIYGSNI